jgi:general stress protein YciG
MRSENPTGMARAWQKIEERVQDSTDSSEIGRDGGSILGGSLFKPEKELAQILGRRFAGIGRRQRKATATPRITLAIFMKTVEA